jgi:predicted ATP-dependent protease
MFSLRADLGEHAQHRLVRPAVERAVERRRRAGERRVRVHLRAADVAHRVRAAVLLVVGVQDEEHVERALEHRVRLVAQLGHLEQHVQEVAGEAQLVVRQTYGRPIVCR